MMWVGTACAVRDILVCSDNYGASRLRCPTEDRHGTEEGGMNLGSFSVFRLNLFCIEDELASEMHTVI